MQKRIEYVTQDKIAPQALLSIGLQSTGILPNTSQTFISVMYKKDGVPAMTAVKVVTTDAKGEVSFSATHGGVGSLSFVSVCFLENLRADDFSSTLGFAKADLAQVVGLGGANSDAFKYWFEDLLKKMK